MRIVSCTGDDRFSVICCTCARWVVFNQAHADLDGEAFKAYYCRQCVGWVEPIAQEVK